MRVAWLTALAIVACLACGGGIPLEAVPSDPIAFVRQEPAKGLLSLDAFREGLRIRAFEEAGQARKPRLHTTLSLLTVPTGEIRSVPDAGEGSLPLDWSMDGLRLLIGRVDSAGGPIQLFSWNRLTGAYDRLSSERSSGAAALGDGPIRLAGVGRLLLPGGTASEGVIIETDTEGTQPLPGGVGGIDPDIAPDGRTVIFVRAPDAHSRREPVMLRSRLGEGEARPLGRGSSPRFSRDGQWIVFLRHRAGNADVWLMRADGTRKRPIATSSYDEDFPAVSLHGDYVVYASARGMVNESQLYMTRVADGEEIQLTRTGQNGRPIW